MLVATPNLSRLRNEVFKKILGGVSASLPEEVIVDRIINDLSSSLVLIDNPNQRKELVREVYDRIQNAHQIRKYNYVYESPEKNKIVGRTLDQILYRFRSKYHRYF